MSQTLQSVYASASGIPHHTLELAAPSFNVANQPSGRILMCQGLDDKVRKTESNETVTYRAYGFGVSLPTKAVTGKQSLQFQVDNVTGEAIQAIDAAIEAGDSISVIYRVYADDELYPAESPVVMNAISASVKTNTVTVVASFNDLVNKAWPYKRYTPTFAPGLKHV